MAGRPHPIPSLYPSLPVHKNSDKTWGEGTWNCLHFLAAWADTPEKMTIVCIQIRFICENLPCKECTDHAVAYIRENPPEKSPDVFEWVWKFHNAVNARPEVNKPYFDYAKCRDRFFGGKIKDCMGCNGEPTKPIAPIGKILTQFNRQ